MDKQIVDKIITEYLPKLYGFAIKKSFFYDEAEDLCADIVQELYGSLLKAEAVYNLEGYIWRISQHTYAKYVSSKKKHEGISLDGLSLPFYENFELGQDASDEEILQLRREIAFLTEKRRRIVYLFYYENKSVSFISREMDLPQGTVKWHLNQARNELKEGFFMERKIGKLGLSPIRAINFGHSGDPGCNGGPEYYLGDTLHLNIVYSVYDSEKTKEEIAEELGMTPVYLEDKIRFLEENGFLVRTSKHRFTTYVKFNPETYSLELEEKQRRKKLEIAKTLVKEYVPCVREAVADVRNVYIPGGNKQLLEAAAIFYGVENKCGISMNRDLSRYRIKTTAGGDFIAFVERKSRQSDPEYRGTLQDRSYQSCGDMIRDSAKYPAVYSWSVDSRYCSRQGGWQNNYTSDYEYLYEFLKGQICDNPANAEKFQRLRERGFLSQDNEVMITMVKGDPEEFFQRIPQLEEGLKKKFANAALEFATANARNYPPQMQDLVISWGVEGFIGGDVALMVLDILYDGGVFRPLTEAERVTFDLLMFSDVLP